MVGADREVLTMVDTAGFSWLTFLKGSKVLAMVDMAGFWWTTFLMGSEV